MMAYGKKRRAEGRYDPQRQARMPANGLARPPITRNVQAALAVVSDPMEAGAELYVTTNRHVDVLENERAHHRISEGAYRTGREIQAVFEKASRIGTGSQWREGDRVDMQVAKEMAIHRNIEAARVIDSEMRRLRGAVGIVGAEFLRLILTGVTFLEYASRSGRGTARREVTIIAGQFRWMLEEIVRVREARGPDPD